VTIKSLPFGSIIFYFRPVIDFIEIDGLLEKVMNVFYIYRYYSVIFFNSIHWFQLPLSFKLGSGLMDSGWVIIHGHRFRVSCMLLNTSFSVNSCRWFMSCLV
jgi:hypothetical protein